MSITEAGIKFIKSWEGFRSKAYPDSGGVWTIGYGTIRYADNSPVQEGDTISEADASKLFSAQLQTYVQAVNESVTSALNQNQFNALVSFAYNLGAANLKQSTLLKKVNASPGDLSIADEFKKWVLAGGSFVQGLLNRRIAEAVMYFTPAGLLTAVKSPVVPVIIGLVILYLVFK